MFQQPRYSRHNLQVQGIELRQELFQSSHTVDALSGQINGVELFPVRLEWLDIREDLYETVMSDGLRAAVNIRDWLEPGARTH